MQTNTTTTITSLNLALGQLDEFWISNHQYVPHRTEITCAQQTISVHCGERERGTCWNVKTEGNVNFSASTCHA